MANLEKALNIQDYLEIGIRRKWYIIVPFLLSIAISYGVYHYQPKVFKASTLILVQPQKVPENYVQSTITESVVSRLNTISQEILSRTRLEKVIGELNLYPDLVKKVPMEEVVEVMRKATEVKVQSSPNNERMQNSFVISFEGREPRTVMVVTNKLASLFIEENLKVRESQAEGTSEFLTKELHTMEEQLKKKDQDIRYFKERNMGHLPQQLDANLRILERLQQQLQTTSENARAAEDRTVHVQTQIEQLRERYQSQREMGFTSPSPGLTSREETRTEQIPQDPLVVQLNILKRELEAAQSKYKEVHPDVVDLKRKIANLEPKAKEALEKQQKEREERLREQKSQQARSGVELPFPAPDPTTERLLTQYSEQMGEARLDARRLKEETKGLKEQITLYERRIEETPRREQELALLTRDYDLVKTNYQSLLDKKIHARMAQNLERKQQGEQFKILDPARLPENPVKPDRNKILLMGLMIGLASGFGLAWLRESLDRSFRTIGDLEADLEVPVLATIPNLREGRKAA